MWAVQDKVSSAIRIARQRGLPGLLQAVGRNLGVQALQGQLDEAAIAWDFFRGQRAPGVMVDVGAHHGSALRPFVRRGWEVHAFEPDAVNRAPLIAEFGGLANLRIDPRAVSDRAMQGVTFYRSEVSSGISGLSAFHASHKAADVTDVTTLTDWAASTGVNTIDFLKIDTEGHDLFVLRGMPWQQLRPRLVLCEFENSKTEPLGYNYDDLVAFLMSKGYTVITSEWYPIQRYGTTHSWKCFAEGTPPAISNQAGWGNLLALRDAADLPALRTACQRAATRNPKPKVGPII